MDQQLSRGPCRDRLSRWSVYDHNSELVNWIIGDSVNGRIAHSDIGAFDTGLMHKNYKH